jgi:hypothetical protein
LQSWRCFLWQGLWNHRKLWVPTMVLRRNDSLALWQMWAEVAKGSGQTRPVQDKPISSSPSYLVWHAGLPWVSCWGSTRDDTTDAGGHRRPFKWWGRPSSEQRWSSSWNQLSTLFRSCHSFRPWCGANTAVWMWQWWPKGQWRWRCFLHNYGLDFVDPCVGSSYMVLATQASLRGGTFLLHRLIAWQWDADLLTQRCTKSLLSKVFYPDPSTHQWKAWTCSTQWEQWDSGKILTPSESNLVAELHLSSAGKLSVQEAED